MAYNVTHWTGAMERDYPIVDFGKLLDELGQADAEHGDISVAHESEWCVSVNRRHFATLENLESGEPVHLGPLERDVLLALMTAVAEGRAQELQRDYPWRAGYPR